MASYTAVPVTAVGVLKCLQALDTTIPGYWAIYQSLLTPYYQVFGLYKSVRLAKRKLGVTIVIIQPTFFLCFWDPTASKWYWVSSLNNNVPS